MRGTGPTVEAAEEDAAKVWLETNQSNWVEIYSSNEDHHGSSLDDLLRVERSPGGRTEEEKIEEMDQKILLLELQHQNETSEMENFKQQMNKEKENRQRRREENVRLKNILISLPQEKLGKMFQEIIPILENIWNGKEFSQKHQDFQKGGAEQIQLMHNALTHPFSDQQVDFLFEAISNLLMRSGGDKVKNSNYVLKVILPETCVRLYANVFSISKEKAQELMYDTPTDE